MKAYWEQERVVCECRESEALATSLANQALLMTYRVNRRKDAPPLAEEAYRITTAYGYMSPTQKVKGTLDSIRAKLGEGG